MVQIKKVIVVGDVPFLHPYWMYRIKQFLRKIRLISIWLKNCRKPMNDKWQPEPITRFYINLKWNENHFKVWTAIRQEIRLKFFTWNFSWIFASCGILSFSLRLPDCGLPFPFSSFFFTLKHWTSLSLAHSLFFTHKHTHTHTLSLGLSRSRLHGHPTQPHSSSLQTNR